MGYSSWGCKESDTTEQLSTDSKTQEKQLEMGDHRPESLSSQVNTTSGSSALLFKKFMNNIKSLKPRDLPRNKMR